jgi:hypothetical protein
MAFFNLTQLGPQNMFKTASSDSRPAPQAQKPGQPPEVILKEGPGANTACSHVRTGSQDEAGSNRTSQLRESTAKEVKFTSTGTAPSTSKPPLHQKSIRDPEKSWQIFDSKT